jgi:hypothetical protein
MITAIVIASCFVTGCQKEDNTDLNETDMIDQSKEYEEYIIAHLNFYNDMHNINGQKIKIGEINGRNVYRTTKNDFNVELLDKIFVTHNELIDKYPEYEKLDVEGKNKLYEVVSVKSQKVAQLIPIESTPVRLKNNLIENASRYIQQHFSNYYNAFMACFKYSSTKKVESGGIILYEGDGIFVIDTMATVKKMSLPVTLIKNNSNNISSTFHYHPRGNPYPSHNDSIAMQAMEEYGVSTLIILAADSTNSQGFTVNRYNF